MPWGHLEAYTDFRDLYLRCLVTPYLAGNGPYHLGTIVYNYPPLFLYLIAGFAAVWNVVWFAAVPLVLFDILTVIPVYLISREFFFAGNARLAFFVSIFWAANPLNLFYNDLMWLNTAPTAFFLILAVYLFLKKEWVFSALSLAVSTGFKQISVIVFPVLLIFLWRATGLSRKLVYYAGCYVGLLVLISTPYVFTDYQNYFWSLNFPIFGLPNGASNSPPVFTASLSEPVRITTFLGFLSKGMAGVVSESYLYLDYALAAVFTAFIVYLIASSLQSPDPLGADVTGQTKRGGFSRSLGALKQLKLRRNISANEVLVFCLTAFLIFFALFGRGVYKYYFASITPLAIPLFRSRIGMVLFEVISLVLFLAPREVTPWMAVLLLTLVPTMLYEEQSGVTVRPA